MTTLQLLSVAEGCNPTPAMRAADDLTRYAEGLSSMAAVLRPSQVGAALKWIREWRMYGLERNRGRWPDGQYYLLNRSYQSWRGHRIALEREVLTTLGCDEWDRRVIVLAHDEDFVPLEADCFHRTPRKELARYAELIQRLAEHFRQATCEPRSGSKKINGKDSDVF